MYVFIKEVQCHLEIMLYRILIGWDKKKLYGINRRLF